MSRVEVRLNYPSVIGMLNKSQRLLLGLFVLLLVDVIWVSSSELTKYIYKNAEFEKPFFNTYVKTSMFTLYLLGLCFWPPWRDQCSKPAHYMDVQAIWDKYHPHHHNVKILAKHGKTITAKVGNLDKYNLVLSIPYFFPDAARKKVVLDKCDAGRKYFFPCRAQNVLLVPWKKKN